MSKEDETENSSHLQKASKSTHLGIISLMLGIYHSVLGFSRWAKNRHIVIQAGITAIITVALGHVANSIGQFFFATFWSHAIYATGLRLRLLPVPLSLAIYTLLLMLIYTGLSLDSSVRELRSELNDLQLEVEELKEENEVRKEKRDHKENSESSD